MEATAQNAMDLRVWKGLQRTEGQGREATGWKELYVGLRQQRAGCFTPPCPSVSVVLPGLPYCSSTSSSYRSKETQFNRQQNQLTRGLSEPSSGLY